MLKMIGVSFMLALQNIRANFLHTLLSVLGIVIGVAALVAILSFIDGIEKYAKEEVAATSSLQSIIITTNTASKVDGVRLEKEDWGYLNPATLKKLEKSLSLPATAYLVANKPQMVNLPDQERTGIILTGVLAGLGPKVKVLAGRVFTEAEVAQKSKVIILNEAMADKLGGGDNRDLVLGKNLQIAGENMKVVGVVQGERKAVAQVVIPITHFSEAALKQNPPFAIVEAHDVLAVTTLKTEIDGWLKANLSRNEDDFSLVTNEFRLAQMEKSFLIFKVVMGLITGIAVLVGGIGIMNVLLISVTERTTEIGIRKATGAKKRDILLQFLLESVAVSGFGSLLGVVLGVIGTLVAVPIVNHLTDAPLQAAFTASTMLLIAILAVVLGIVFGTYPAMRAAGMDPVEAIRHE